MTARGKPAGKARLRVSFEKRAAARENIKKAHVAQRTYPLCNAKRRDGGRCGNLGTGTGGRCRLHGGATPTGKDWHRVQLTNAGKSVGRMDRKLKDIERRRARQAARVAAMTPEERAKHDNWHATHKPGGEDVRRAARQAREVRTMLSGLASAPPVETPEVRAIREAIQDLECQAANLKPPVTGPVTEDPFS